MSVNTNGTPQTMIEAQAAEIEQLQEKLAKLESDNLKYYQALGRRTAQIQERDDCIRDLWGDMGLLNVNGESSYVQDCFNEDHPNRRALIEKITENDLE